MKTLISFNFYILLETFGIVAGFNTKNEANEYIKHEVQLIYEGMDNERQKERAAARKEYIIIDKVNADKYTGYIVTDLIR